MPHPRAGEIFEQAIEVAPDARARWLDAACAGDKALRDEVEGMLRVDARAEHFLEVPPALLGGHPERRPGRPETPRAFGAWRVLRALGVGGMGEVWLAERNDGQFEQRGAVKQLAYPTPGLLQRFRQERQILARLEHPNIARLIDGGVDADGAPYLVMEFIDGVPLTDFVRDRDLSLAASLQLFLVICDAVQYAHQNLVVHRDLKPANIFVTPAGVPKLLDFGIAKVLATTDSVAATQTVARLLTPDYAAPEQFSGGAITTATDVYALGVVLYEVLAGARPARRVADSELVAPSATVHRATGDRRRRRALRGDLDRIALTALAHDPAHRYSSAEALAADIRRFLGGLPIAARGHGALYRLRKFAGRNRYVLGTAVLAFVVCVAAALLSLRQAAIARDQAQRSDAVQKFLVGVFEQAAPDNSMNKPLSAHQLLEIGERGLARGESISPDARTELTALIGDLYWSIGDYTKAETLLKSAVAANEHLPVSDVARARALRWLARTERERNLFDLAITHAAQALPLALRAGGDGVGEASEVRRLIADIQTGQGDAAKAVPLLREALAGDRVAFGSRSQAVLDDLVLLATALKEMSLYDDSISASRELIGTATAMHGRLHSDVVNGLEVLASALGHRGDFAAAETNLREAAAIAEQVFGPAHRETVVARSNLYWTLEMQGRFAEALQGRLQLLGIEQSMSDTRPEQMAYAYNFLASDYSALGRFGEAEAAARKSLAVWQDIHGHELQWDSCDSLRNLGIVLQLTGRYADAQAAFGQDIEILRKHEAPTSEWLNRDRGTLGDILRLSHRPAEGARMIGDALAALPPPAGQSSPIRIYLMALLGEAQLDAGDAATAEATMVQAVTAARSGMPAGSLKLAQPLFALARAKLARGHAGEAESLLREALGLRQAVHPAGDPRVLEVQVTLANALDAQGRHDDATALAAQIRPGLAALSSPYGDDLRSRLASR